nr:immunoglobulin light chain junction region [Macaca mulatta]
CQQYSNLKTF